MLLWNVFQQTTQHYIPEDMTSEKSVRQHDILRAATVFLMSWHIIDVSYHPFAITLGRRLTTYATYDHTKKGKKIKKYIYIYIIIIINQAVLLRTSIMQDAVRCYCEIYEGGKKRNKLFKQSSACSSSRKHLLLQPKNKTLICTVQYR
jgi:hypothetical protein